MTMIRVINLTRSAVLGTRVRLADGLASRVRGFLFRAPPAGGEGILLSPCRAVHMFGVRFALDVVFISAHGVVVATYPDLRPWRRSAIHGSAFYALELPAGTIRATGTAVGDDLSWTATGAGAEADGSHTSAAPEPRAEPAGPRPATADADIEADIEATSELPAESRPEATRRQA